MQVLLQHSYWVLNDVWAHLQKQLSYRRESFNRNKKCNSVMEKASLQFWELLLQYFWWFYFFELVAMSEKNYSVI